MSKQNDNKTDLQNKTDFSFEKTIKKGARKVIVSVTIAMVVIMAITVIIIKFL